MPGWASDEGKDQSPVFIPACVLETESARCPGDGHNDSGVDLDALNLQDRHPHRL